MWRHKNPALIYGQDFLGLLHLEERKGILFNFYRIFFVTVFDLYFFVLYFFVPVELLSFFAFTVFVLSKVKQI